MHATRLWSWTRSNFGWILIFLLFLFGIGGIAAELAYAQSADARVATASVFAGEVGKAALGGGFAGVILKLMTLQGIFLDAVAAVAYGPEGLSRRSEADRKHLWRELTRMIYLPFLTPSASSSARELNGQELAAQIERSITETFTYNQKFYIQRLHRRLEFTWADERARRIQVLETQTIEIVPFSDKEEIVWVATSAPDAGRSMAEYETAAEDYTITPQPQSPPKTNEDTDARQTTCVLKGSARYDVWRKRVRRWSLNADPILATVSPYVVQALTIDILNRAPGLRITFKDIGGATLFVASGGVGKQIDYLEESCLRLDHLLLPDQGYLLLLVALNADPDETAAAQHRN